MDDILSALENEYSPPIDSALFSAIISDFDLADPDALSSARETLDAIKGSAFEEQEGDFDPSGSAKPTTDTENGAYLGMDGVSSEADVSHSEGTDLTSLSNGVQSLEISAYDSSPVAEAENLDDISKVALLREMFPKSTEFAISHTLKKCGGSWNRAVEELLNHAFFEGQGSDVADDRIPAKGIDAFSEDHNFRRGRRKVKNRIKTNSGDDPSGRSSSAPIAAPLTPWQRAKQDIDFLSLRVNVPASTISSTYHKHGASLHSTIVSLAEDSSRKADTPTSDSTLQAKAFELGKDFPSITADYLTGLVRLTHPSTAAAHELAKVIAAPALSERAGGIEIITHYAPIASVPPEDSDENWDGGVSPKPRPHSGASTPIVTSSGDPFVNARSYQQAQQRSFDQASAAYRRGRSDHLMSAAAAYYSQQGRDYAMKRAEATAEAADALVDSQSSAGEIDLHGVSVKDAVRIARSRTEKWWRGRGTRAMGVDGRVRDEGDLGQPFRIVTGLGRHSAGARARIGPAVGKMLFAEGWTVSIGDGIFSVYGKKK